jgi:group II intron reverse transcriptase/maturase
MVERPKHSGWRTPVDKVQQLQRRLWMAAKGSPDRRFHALYDRIYRSDVLWEAWRRVKRNRGAAGVDRQTLAAVEELGVERLIGELHDELREGRYRPRAVKRQYILKADGRQRPLGIPTVRDRVVQAAAKLVLEPIFEADFTDNAYGYRPGRSAQGAVREVHKSLKAGYTHVVDADLSQFFDTIPHAGLLRSVARRVCDGAVLHLIKMWLKAPIQEESESGKPTRRGSGNRGTPQGGIMSPLLANIYMRRFLKAWEQRGNAKRFACRIVNYADDFVILCGRDAAAALDEARDIFTRIGLVLNEKKTRICCARDEPFDFLGYSFGVQYSFGSGRPYLAAYPSAKSLRKLKAKLRSWIGNHSTLLSEDALAESVNRTVRGWMNYFSYGTLWKMYARLERFLQQRIRGWLVHKHRVESRGECRYPADYIYDRMGVVSPARALGSRKP